MLPLGVDEATARVITDRREHDGRRHEKPCQLSSVEMNPSLGHRSQILHHVSKSACVNRSQELLDNGAIRKLSQEGNWAISGTKMSSQKVISLSQALGCHHEQDPIGCLVRRLRLRLLRFKSYEHVVTGAAEAAVGPPPTSGIAACMGHRAKVEELVDAARRCFVRTGSLPKRRLVRGFAHEFPDSELTVFVQRLQAQVALGAPQRTSRYNSNQY